MKQITPQVYAWSQYAPAQRRDRNGHFVQRVPASRGS